MKRISTELLAHNTCGEKEAIILAERRFEDITKLTQSEFVQMMREDIKTANRDFDEAWKKHRAEIREKIIQEDVDRDMSQSWIQNKAASYKLDSWRDKFLNSLRLDFEKKRAEWYDKHTDFTCPGYYDFDTHPGKNGINGNCILTEDSTDYALEDCFRDIRSSKYFDKSHGWMIGYTTSVGGLEPKWRPFVVLILDEEQVKQFHQEMEDLGRAISEFYANCRYCGD